MDFIHFSVDKVSKVNRNRNRKGTNKTAAVKQHSHNDQLTPWVTTHDLVAGGLQWTKYSIQPSKNQTELP